MDATVPDAWPALLSREQLRAYLGGICDATLRKVCPVAPLDLGANVVRYRRRDVDAWLDRLPERVLRRLLAGAQDSAQPESAAAANDPPDRPLSAVDRARARAAGKR